VGRKEYKKTAQARAGKIPRKNAATNAYKDPEDKLKELEQTGIKCAKPTRDRDR